MSGAGRIGRADDRSRDIGEMAQLRGLAEEIVTDAAALLRSLPRPGAAGAEPGADVRTKSSPTDVVTANDVALEAFVRDRLRTRRPADQVVGEEQGGSATAGTTVWVVDPIDGTVNFLYGLPWYAVSLAAVRDGVSVAGAVVEPASGRLWSAALGAGSTLDGRPLRVSATTDPALAMVATGFAYQAERRTRQVRMVGGMLPHVRDVRRVGAAALDLCAVAAGWVDAYVEHGTHWWDWAAAALIAREAGAVVRTPGPPGATPPEDGLGADALLAAAPGVAEAIACLAR